MCDCYFSSHIYLMHAYWNGKLILNNEAPLFSACLSGNENLVKYLIEQGADINEEGHRFETPLFNACKSGNENLVKYLIECGADISIKERWTEKKHHYLMRI